MASFVPGHAARAFRGVSFLCPWRPSDWGILCLQPGTTTPAAWNYYARFLGVLSH